MKDKRKSLDVTMSADVTSTGGSVSMVTSTGKGIQVLYDKESIFDTGTRTMKEASWIKIHTYNNSETAGEAIIEFMMMEMNASDCTELTLFYSGDPAEWKWFMEMLPDDWGNDVHPISLSTVMWVCGIDHTAVTLGEWVDGFEFAMMKDVVATLPDGNTLRNAIMMMYAFGKFVYSRNGNVNQIFVR